MVDTALSSLAQNLEGPDWPIKGPDETPAAYIDLAYDEAAELLQMKGYPGKMGLLISLLKDTLAFDDPFGEMVEQSAQTAERENTLLKNLAKLGIPEEFPINLTGLDQGTLEFCRLEQLPTLGAFARFAQTMSQQVIVGGDFRKLLNALSHVDEIGLAALIPFRAGAKGLHLVECLAQTSRSGNVPERTAEALAHFADDLSALRARMAAGADLQREIMVLNDAEAENRVVGILTPLLGDKPAEPVKKGFFSRLFGK
ncbi:MAG: hypothetical protein IT582_11865 [Opitutaceae bacterium]|nr:hypothetical protein [Opitutaceae bacterium]